MQTKTSGPGKKMEVLPIFVSQEAYLVKPWLQVGLELFWQKSELASERDFFLPLPDASLKAATNIRALYSDSAAFSQGLWASLAISDSTALLPHGAGGFSTKHSDRAGLDSWAAALGAGKTERNFLGRWKAKGVTDTYVRTALRVIENLQLVAAQRARESLANGPVTSGKGTFSPGTRIGSRPTTGTRMRPRPWWPP